MSDMFASENRGYGDGMRPFALVIALLTLLACGGSVPPVPSPDAATDAAAQPDAAPLDAAPEADAPACVCVGANFGTRMCGGVQAPDAESCLYCGGHCDSTDGG